MKTEGDLNVRTRKLGLLLWPALVVLTVLSLIATVYVRPELLDNYQRYPAGFLIPILVVASLAGMFIWQRTGNERNAFLSSCGYLGGMLAGAAFGIYPNLLLANADPAYNITIFNAAAGRYSLTGGLVWWTVGMLVAIGYFVFVYRMFRGKVSTGEDGGH